MSLFPLILALVGAEPSLATLHEIAALDLRVRVKAQDQPFTRYLSMHGFAPEERGDAYTALLLALNGASIRGEFHRPTVIAGGRLLRLNLRALGWDRYSREAELEKLAKLGVKNAVGKNTGASLEFKTERDRAFFLEIWDSIGFSEPYFVVNGAYGNKYIRGWIDPGVVADAAKYAQTEKLVVAAHWFLPRLLLEAQDGGYYSQLLILPGDRKDLEKRLGVNRPFADADPRAKHGAAVIQSGGVAYQPREVELLTSATGYDQFAYWITDDYRIDDKVRRDRKLAVRKDPRDSPADTSEPDAQEVLFTLWNGLQGGYLCNGQGKQQAFAPQQIAEDQRELIAGADGKPSVYFSPTKTVFNYGKCVDCHGQSRGYIGFNDNFYKLLSPDRDDVGAGVIDYSAKRAAREIDRIKDFYRAGLREKMELHRASYEARVLALTGLNVLDATRVMLRMYDRCTAVYAAQLVTPERAVREYAIPIEGARALWKAATVIDRQNQLGYLSQGQSITRSVWERVLGDGLRKDEFRWDPAKVKVPLQIKGH